MAMEFIKRLFLLFYLSLPLTASAHVNIVVSFSILKDLVENIGGEHVKVFSLVGPNGDAHIFEPTPDSSALISKADLVVTNGLGFEGWIDRLIEATNYKGPISVASQGIPSRRAAEGKEILDPHAWHDVMHVMTYAKNISKALVACDPAHQKVYRKRTQAYLKKLEALHKWILDEFKTVPLEKRRLITAHDAFHYFADRYRIQVLSPQGITTGAEPSAKALAELMVQIKKEGIKALFLENMTNPKLMEQLSRDSGIAPAGTLYSDALSEKGEGGETYEQMMRHNVTLIKKAISLNESRTSHQQ